MAIEAVHLEDTDDGRDVRQRVQRQILALAAGAAALLVAMGVVTTWVQARLDKAHHEVAGVAVAQQLNAETASQHEDLKGALVTALTLRRGDTQSAQDARQKAADATTALRVTLREGSAQSLPVTQTAAARRMRDADLAFSLREDEVIDLALAGRDVATQVRALSQLDETVDAQRDAYASALAQTAAKAAKDSERAQELGHALVGTTVGLALLMLGWTVARLRRSVLGVTRR